FVDKEMKPGDRVAVVAHDVRLKIYSDFTTDKTQLKQALQEAAMFGRGLDSTTEATAPSILRNLDRSTLIDRTGTVYEALQALGDAMRPIHARKDVVVFYIDIVEPGGYVRGRVIVRNSRT